MAIKVIKSKEFDVVFTMLNKKLNLERSKKAETEMGSKGKAETEVSSKEKAEKEIGWRKKEKESEEDSDEEFYEEVLE